MGMIGVFKKALGLASPRHVQGLNQAAIDLEFDDFNVDLSNSQMALMSHLELKFLIMLIDKASPKKILEIGTAAGGTTRIVLENLKNDTKMYSVDISSAYFRDKTKPTGYVASENLTTEQLSRWVTFFGTDIVDCIEQIGSNIDFVIIDTTHVLPGEFLSFLAIIPYLSSKCVIVLHDTALHYLYCKDIATINKYTTYALDSYCTNILLHVVSSDNKMYPPAGIANIGAFVYSEFSEQNIEDIFSILLLPWHHIPESSLLGRYKIFFEKHYSKKCQALFLESTAIQPNIQLYRANEKAAIQELEKALVQGQETIKKLRQELDDSLAEQHHFTTATQEIKTALTQELDNLSSLRTNLHAVSNELYALKNERNNILNDVCRLFGSSDPSSEANLNFNEQYYLKANPDVQDAIDRKLIPSGLFHWIKFGCEEGRNVFFIPDEDIKKFNEQFQNKDRQ